MFLVCLNFSSRNKTTFQTKDILKSSQKYWVGESTYEFQSSTKSAMKKVFYTFNGKWKFIHATKIHLKVFIVISIIIDLILPICHRSELDITS